MNSVISFSLNKALEFSIYDRRISADRVQHGLIRQPSCLVKGRKLSTSLGQPSQRSLTRSRSTSVRVFAAADAPEKAYSAIVQGQEQYKAKDFSSALVTFEKALSLPGSGLKQFTDKPAIISDQERATALFNIACCQCQLDNERLAMVAIAGALESGFSQFDLLVTEPDLELLRASKKFPGLVSMFNKATAAKLYAIVTGEELPQERSGLEAFKRGDWLWKALTKTRAPTEKEFLDLTTPPKKKE